jgi:hypothetical protein
MCNKNKEKQRKYWPNKITRREELIRLAGSPQNLSELSNK